MSSDLHAEYPNFMDNGEPLCGDDDPSNTHALPIFVTSDYAHSIGAHCHQCYCGIAVTEKRAGIVNSPNYGWSSETDNQTGEERSKELYEKRGVAQKQPKIVILLETGRVQQKIKEELELGKRSKVSACIRQYRDSREEIELFADQGVGI